MKEKREWWGGAVGWSRLGKNGGGGGREQLRKREITGTSGN